MELGQLLEVQHESRGVCEYLPAILRHCRTAFVFITPPEDRAEAEQLTHEPTVHGDEGEEAPYPSKDEAYTHDGS